MSCDGATTNRDGADLVASVALLFNSDGAALMS